MSEAPVPEGEAPEMILNVTEIARQKVLRVRAAENEPEKLALWLEIAGVANGKYKYDMYFQPIDYAGPTDIVQRHDDLSIVIPAFSIDKVRGATLDVAGDPTDGGLVLDNPNSPSPAVGAAGAARPPADLTGGEKVGRLVGAAGKQEQDAGHARYHGGSRPPVRSGSDRSRARRGHEVG